MVLQDGRGVRVRQYTRQTHWMLQYFRQRALGPPLLSTGHYLLWTAMSCRFSFFFPHFRGSTINIFLRFFLGFFSLMYVTPTHITSALLKPCIWCFVSLQIRSQTQERAKLNVKKDSGFGAGAYFPTIL